MLSDVDVIDMTWLGSNVHALRHSYWSLNREVIEDLRYVSIHPGVSSAARPL